MGEHRVPGGGVPRRQEAVGLPALDQVVREIVVVDREWADLGVAITREEGPGALVSEELAREIARRTHVHRGHATLDQRTDRGEQRVRIRSDAVERRLGGGIRLCVEERREMGEVHDGDPPLAVGLLDPLDRGGGTDPDELGEAQGPGDLDAGRRKILPPDAQPGRAAFPQIAPQRWRIGGHGSIDRRPDPREREHLFDRTQHDDPRAVRRKLRDDAREGLFGRGLRRRPCDREGPTPELPEIELALAEGSKGVAHDGGV